MKRTWICRSTAFRRPAKLVSKWCRRTSHRWATSKRCCVHVRQRRFPVAFVWVQRGGALWLQRRISRSVGDSCLSQRGSKRLSQRQTGRIGFKRKWLNPIKLNLFLVYTMFRQIRTVSVLANHLALSPICDAAVVPAWTRTYVSFCGQREHSEKYWNGLI